MERLFTESQWRAISQVEKFTDGREAWDGFTMWCARKRIYGPLFIDGEFYIGWREKSSFNEVKIFEKQSDLVVSCNAADKWIALASARTILSQIPRDYLIEMMAKRRPNVAAKLAQWETKKAIEIAKKRSSAVSKNKIIPKRRKLIFEASGGKCHYCQTALTLDGKWHIEHMMPKALFGSNEPSNLVASCIPCNSAKRDRTDQEFLARMKSASTV